MNLKTVLICFLLLAIKVKAQSDLSFYIEKAKQNSPLIFDNQIQEKANLIELERIKAFYNKAQIGVTATYMFSPIINQDNQKSRFEANSQGAEKYYGYDFAAANGGQYQALLNINQPLFNQNKSKTAGEVVEVNIEINKNNVAISSHDIEKIVTDQYIICQQDLEQINYSNKLLSLLNDQKNTVLNLVQNGMYKQSDLFLLDIELENAHAITIGYIANYKRDLVDLKIISGINDTSNVLLNPVDIVLNFQKDHSLFLNKYFLDSLTLVKTRKSFELKYKPQFSVYANTGLNAVYAPNIPNRFGLGAGFNFAYNFYDGNQRKLFKNKTDVLLQSISFSKNNFTIQNNLRKSKLLQEIQSFSERILINEKQLSDYDKLINTYKSEVLSGQLSIINFMAVIKNKMLLERDLIVLKAQKLSLINTYNYWNW